MNTDTTRYHRRYTIGCQTLSDAGTNRQNPYTEKNKTIILDLTNIVRLLIYYHNNVFLRSRLEIHLFGTFL